MANLDGKILSVTEPNVFWLDDMEILDRESPGGSQESAVKPSKFIGSVIPYVTINGMEISADMLLYFELNTSQFLPTLRLRIRDTSMLFMGRHFPKDGDVVNFLIRANNESVFKPIRIDFDIIGIAPGYSIDPRASQTFNITAQMKIPDLLSEDCRAYKELTSFDTLLELSQQLGLGFSSNVEDTTDTMTWVNPCDTRLKFIKDITSNSYLNDDSFFISCIDTYYMLNFVNLNSLFSTDESIEDSELYLLNPGDMKMDWDDDTGTGKSAQMLTNLHQYQGNSQYVSKHRMINNSGRIFLTNGYKRFAQFYEINENGKNGEFISEFVDPLTTDGTEDKIHLKGRYVGDIDNRKTEGIAENQVKFKYLGKQQPLPEGNVHENYLFSNILNFQNNEETFKMGMIVDLDMVNATLYRYQRIPIFIYDYGHLEKKIYEEGAQVRGDEIKDSDTVDSEGQQTGRLNKFLSGFYLIVGINYFWTAPGPIRQRLVLVRREFDPSP